MMRIGSQRCIIDIQRRMQIGLDKLRHPIFAWSNWRSKIFAEIEVRRGKEQFDPTSRIRYSEDVYRFRTRFDEVVGIDASMRVLHDDSVFDIKAILPDVHRRIDCIIECTTQDAVLGGKVPLNAAIGSVIGAGVVGEAYEILVEASGGRSPYAFSILRGALPTGLSIMASTGQITGTPTVAGTYDFVVSISDAAGDRIEMPSVSIVVESA